MAHLICGSVMSRHGLPDIDELPDHLAELCSGFKQPTCRRKSGDSYSSCNSICATCFENERRRLILAGSKLAYKKRWRGGMYTLVNSRWSAPEGHLDKLEYKPIFEKLKECLVAEYVSVEGRMAAIVGMEISLNEVGRKDDIFSTQKPKRHYEWVVHFHIVTICKNPKELRPFLELLTKGQHNDGLKPLRFDPSYCVGRHIAYATKFKSTRRGIGTDIRNNSKPKERPLDRKRKSEALSWFQKIPSDERMFSIGI